MIKKILFLFLFIFLASSVYGFDIEYNFKVNEVEQLKFKCVDGGLLCDGTYSCNITVYDPDGDTVLDNLEATKNSADYNITINNTELGVYRYDPYCSNGTNGGAETLYYEVTPNGERPNTAKAILYLGLLLLLVSLLALSLMAHFKDQFSIWKIWWFSIVWVLAIAVSFVAWNMSADFLTGTPFLASMFRILFLFLTILFFPFLMFLGLYSAYLIYRMKEIQGIIEGRGLDVDSAEYMVERKRSRRKRR